MEGFDHILNWRLLRGSHEFPGKDGGTCINEAAVIAAADAIGRPKRVGKIWVVTGDGGSEGFFVWMLLNYPKVACRLFGKFIVLEEESLKRLHNKARLSCVMEVLKVLMIPVELKPLHTTAHPSCVLELLELLAHSAARRF